MKSQLFNVAMYLRLSREDEDIDGAVKYESNSIGSQREIARTFIREQNDMELYDIYIDEGFTGSNFERPEFKRMIQDVEEGKVNCVIVKDLSRFGRDYIETGRYIQKTFPALGVRFIAITDHYDSFHADSGESTIILPVKNFINDSYCRDISIKVKTQLDAKRKNGEFVGSFAVYGYLKNPQNKNQLIIDDYAAGIVRQIFSWKIEGISAFGIANKLSELGILSPMEYKKSLGVKFKTGFAKNVKNGWNCVTVKRILTNEVYLGHLIQGKNQKISYKVQKKIEKPQEEWIRVEHVHDAIITEDDFATVQILQKSDVRVSPSNHNEVNPFAGLLYCGDCKEQMVRRVNKYKGSSSVFYICSTKNRGEGCTRHSIREKLLLEVVTEAIHKYANSFLSQKCLLEQSEGLEINFEIITKYDKEIRRLQGEQEKYYKLCSGLYEDLKNGVVNKKELERLQQKYSDKNEALEVAMTKQENLIKDMFKKGVASDRRLQNFKECAELKVIDRRTMASLIKKIYVYEDKRIEIQFRFQDVFQTMLNTNRLITHTENLQKRL